MIQKSELTQVPVEQRVPGRVYGVSDSLEGELYVVKIYHNYSNDIDGCQWTFWFALPESMLPVRELPDEFELKQGEWEIDNVDGTNFSPMLYSWNVRRLRQLKFPKLTIPSGTKSEQIAELEKILAELKQL
jgi:hypothetical protein